MNSESKQCRFCAESIPSAAKVCPRCRQWLTLWSSRNPNVAIWVQGLPFGILLVFLTTVGLSRFVNVLNPSPQYAEAHEPLRVVKSEMN
jgi:predicted nucleic acid-binding Zn ribbon protein